jgi:phospholipase C
MTKSDRRTFLRLLGSSTLAAALPQSIDRALAIPANNLTGTIQDIEHIVILMQENRSFDHYFGALRGVRGFGDPRAVNLPSGKPVWHQPDGNGGEVLPFRPSAPHLGLQFLEDLPHGWTDQHGAWNNGNHDGWVPWKGTTTMSHLIRDDIPFHYALADAFTICDSYHCSLMGPTDPNRYHMWTGYVGNDGKGGGPVIDNAEAGYGWSTFPERLEKAGVSWKIYQDVGVGLTAEGYWGWTEDAYIGNYGDNSLLYFHKYQNAKPGNPLADKAKTGTNISAGGTLFEIFQHDVQTDSLPQVSWIVSPEAYSEHPNWPPNYGAWYVSQFLDALTANPKVWSKTALFVTYDENDGFFDHLVPPYPPASAAEGLSTVPITNEIFGGDSSYAAGPYGLGFRVPMIVVSPWSKGGFVNSEVFDHTSLIRFIQQRFGSAYPGLNEPNITPWRRAVCGDLTSAFNFARPNAARVPLPGTASYVPPDDQRHDDYSPTPPVNQAVPRQEPGIRFARALPYELHVAGQADVANATFAIDFGNTGQAAASFHVRSGIAGSGPWVYTVAPHKKLSDSWSVSGNPDGGYDLSVHGPNGFFRHFKGHVGGRTDLGVTAAYDAAGNGISLSVTNNAATTAEVMVADAYTGAVETEVLPAGQGFTKYWPLKGSYGWYDLTVSAVGDGSFGQQLAGHVETGKDSYSDPAIGGLGRAP